MHTVVSYCENGGVTSVLYNTDTGFELHRAVAEPPGPFIVGATGGAWIQQGADCVIKDAEGAFWFAMAMEAKRKATGINF